jgi:hypothetical protein
MGICSYQLLEFLTNNFYFEKSSQNFIENLQQLAKQKLKEKRIEV